MNLKFNTQKSFIEDRIRETLHGLANTFNTRGFMIDEGNPSDQDDVESINELSDTFCKNIKILHRLITAYFELLGGNKSLEEFDKFIVQNTGNNLFDEETVYDDFYHASRVVLEIWNFLSPYEFVNEDYSNLLLKNKGLEYLERILRNTEHIIQHEKKEPTSETQVYNAVKFYLNTVIPSASDPTKVFLKKFSYYAPDIVLPELHAVVEYKYVDDKAELSGMIGQLLADAKQYTDNEQYLFCYAVIYLTESFISVDEFEHYWNAFNFPTTWKYILVYGRDYREKGSKNFALTP